MDNQQAKLILLAYRPGGQDAADPRFAEALEQARRDPELRAWFAEQKKFDAAVGERLQSVPVPAGLRETILVEHQTAAAMKHRRRLAPLALAAILIATVTLAAWWLLPAGRFARASLASFEREMPGLLSEGFDLEFLSADAFALQNWLREARAFDEISLPASLSTLPGYGCRVLDWRGRKVGLICFRAQDGKFVHLFTIPRAELAAFSPNGEFHLAHTRDWATASWVLGDRVFLLATLGDEASLKAFLPLTRG